MDYCDSIQILKDMRKNQSVWRSKRIINRAKKLQEQGEKAKHFCKGFDDDTGSGLFDIIVSHFIE